MPLAAPVTAMAAPGIAVMGDHSGFLGPRGFPESGSQRPDQAEIKQAGIKQRESKRRAQGPPLFKVTSRTGCPGRARLHPGLRNYFFFDFLAFFAFFAFFAFLAIASSFELMD
jgi:hypothetical protein